MSSPADHIAAGTAGKLLVADTDARILRAALRLLARGAPVTVAELADAAGVSDLDVATGPAGHDIEYDADGRIVGLGLTPNPTPHRFTVDGCTMYTWCAPDTLIFPPVIGRPARVASECPATGATVRLTVDPTTGVAGLDPATAVVSLVDPDSIDADQVRATLCNPQRFFASADAARDWQARYPGMTVLPVADGYRDVALPLARAILES